MLHQFVFSVLVLSALYFAVACGDQNVSSAVEINQADFGLKLLQYAGHTEESTVLSPLSIAVALSMAYAGAKGETHRQMKAVLANDVADETLHGYFGALLRDLSAPNGSSQLISANKLFVRNGTELHNSFINTINARYSGQLEEIDFSRPAAAAKKINSWVRLRTNSKIDELVTVDVLRDSPFMVLVNAVYFKAKWLMKFSRRRTAKKLFYESENITKEVDMMKAKQRFPYFANEEVEVLGLPYADKSTVMYVFLPRHRYGLTALEKSLSGEKLIHFVQLCNENKDFVIVSFPKFKLEQEFELVTILKKLGIVNAFNHAADFSGMTSSAVFISAVLHKSFAEVNEEGTEAAGATAKVTKYRSGSIFLSEPIRFVADHPFLFAIVKANTIVFIGRVR